MTPQELKNSILQLAIQGKLVKQRPEEGTAEELYQQIQAKKQKLIKVGTINREKPLPEITEDEKPFDIPESWKWVRIGQIFSLQAGKNITASDIYEEPSPEHSFLCYGGNGIRGYVNSNNRSGHYALIGRQGALCGNINFADGDFYATEHAVVVDQFQMCDVLWNGYFLRALNLNQYATATAQPGLAVNNIVKVLIPLPPLAEQRRIVAKIEELLPYIDRYEQAWSKLEDFNKRFPNDMQKSILQIAIQGKLVEQHPEEGTGEELYQKIQAEKQRLIKAGTIKKENPLPEISEDEKPFDIPENWIWIKLGELLTYQNGYAYNSSDMNESCKGYPVIKSGNLMTLNVVIKEKNDYIDIPTEKMLKCQINKGDMLMCLSSQSNNPEPLGKTAIYEFNTPALLNQRVLKMKPLNPVTTEYLYFAINSEYFHFTVSHQGGGSAQANLKLEHVLNMLIPLPPLAEQKRIVAKLEEILPLCEKMK